MSIDLSAIRHRRRYTGERTRNKRLAPNRSTGAFERMVKRTRAQAKTDDLAFPIRVKILIPERGLSALPHGLHDWLRAELGPLRYAVHAASGIGTYGQQSALYFRSVEDARRCVEAFPELELADGVANVTYYAPRVAVTLSSR